MQYRCRRAENIVVGAKLNVMPEEDPKDAHKESALGGPEPGPNGAEPEVPEDADLFAADVHEELSERQIFVGDEDFYRSLEQYAQKTNVPPGLGKQRMKPILLRLIPRLRLSAAQITLVAGIVAIGALLFYTIFSPSDSPADSDSPHTLKTADRQTLRPEPPDVDSALIAHKLPQGQTPLASAELKARPWRGEPQPSAPASLKVAQDLYLQQKYNEAYAVYDRLRQSLPDKASAFGGQKDFLKLKMALCDLKAGRLEQANRALNETAKSASHIVKLMTNYHRVSLDMQRKQYLNARKRAYLVIALIAAVDIDTKLASAIRSNCYFRIAEAMTRNVLSLSDDDSDLPPKLWSAPPRRTEIDPFAELDNEQLEALLKSGSDYLAQGLLTPQIRKITHEDGTILWSAVCNGAPIQELLARFAANAGLDLSWIFSPPRQAQTPLQTHDIAHTKPVVLYLPVTNQQQLIAAAAGQVGLLAHIENNNIAVYQPDKFSSLSRHISLLGDETISLWQRFLLTFQSDKRIANAHFALGLLYAREGGIPEAIAEYKLVANRFSFSSLAPYALLHSSKLKSGPKVGDYVGAKQDLEQLVSQYPDNDVTTRAYAHLAEYAAKTGLMKEAAGTYRKIYNLGLSAQSQNAAALGAGKCFYQINDYNAAAKWLTLHIDSAAQDRKSEDVCTAYALLGKTYLALKNPQQAYLAFQHALNGQLPKEEYVETVSAMINGYVEQRKFIQALDALENVDFWRFSQTESVKILLLKSRILQNMGLTDKAIAVLDNQAEYISDPQLKAEILFDIANCYITQGQLQLAHEELTNLLLVVRPGPLAYRIAIRLAETCSMLGLNSQAVSVCTQLMEADIPEQTRSKAAVILAMAHNAQQDYDSAALALLDKQK